MKKNITACDQRSYTLCSDIKWSSYISNLRICISKSPSLTQNLFCCFLLYYHHFQWNAYSLHSFIHSFVHSSIYALSPSSRKFLFLTSIHAYTQRSNYISSSRICTSKSPSITQALSSCFLLLLSPITLKCLFPTFIHASRYILSPFSRKLLFLTFTHAYTHPYMYIYQQYLLVRWLLKIIIIFNQGEKYYWEYNQSRTLLDKEKIKGIEMRTPIPIGMRSFG